MSVSTHWWALDDVLAASQLGPRPFANALANAIQELHHETQVLVMISDRSKELLRIKGLSPSLSTSIAEVSWPKSDQQDSNLGLFYRHSVPESVAALMSVDKPFRASVYVKLNELESTLDGTHEYLAICIACNDPDALNALTQAVPTATPAIGRLYAASLDALKLRMRTRLVIESSKSRDIGSLMYRAARLAQDELHLSRVVLVVRAESHLYIRAVQPAVPGGSNNAVHLVAPREGGSGAVSLALETGNPKFATPRELEREVALLLPKGVEEILVYPFLNSPSGPGDYPRGAMICMGKEWSPSGRSQQGSFIWEDHELTSFFVDMLTTLTSMLQSRDDAAVRVERVLHGAKDLFRKIRNNLSLLEEDGNVSEKVAAEMQYLLPDAIALLDDISAQLERKRLSGQPKIPTDERVLLYADVLAPISAFGHGLARAMGRNALHVSSLEAAGFRHAPVVRSNVNALTTVFRNLVHNSVKYSLREEGSEAWIDFQWQASGGILTVLVSDHGIGIPWVERERIFVEGYRTERAQQTDPNGIGVGLSDCRDIMTLLGGNIQVVSPVDTPQGKASTTIAVSIPVGFKGA